MKRIPPERVIERFLEVMPPLQGGCWLWPRSVGSHGYGQIGWQYQTDPPKRTMELTHRLSWYLVYGCIPEDMTIDHICRVRRCCNPSHLRLLTNVDNARDNGNKRKINCPAGHSYAGSNLYVSPKGDRRRRTCANERKC